MKDIQKNIKDKIPTEPQHLAQLNNYLASLSVFSAAISNKVKIITLNHSDFPSKALPYEREIISRKAFNKGISDAREEDIICISDVDEIIDFEKLNKIKNKENDLRN
mgnify:CR=1 FL=1